MKKVAFIGHRNVWKNIRSNLYEIVKGYIKKGYRIFTMGTHGEFDKIALSVCRELRKIYQDIVIEVVITSLVQIGQSLDLKNKEIIGYKPYSDVTTVMYDIEEEHFKRKIVVSNQQMIDTCDTLICYVDTKSTHGGAILAYKYALKKGLSIVNLF